MFELLMQPEIKRRIEEKAHLIMPRTRWDGFKKESDVLEVYEPGTREDTGYQPRLDT
jgi:hypothetical protein